MRLDEADPKGLVRESYRIEGISLGECRSILVDWALSLPLDAPMKEAIRVVMAEYATAAPDHPMIDSIWRERRTIVRQSIGIGGRARQRLFAALLNVETRRMPDDKNNAIVGTHSEEQDL